jgi:hypothetical protein
MSDEADKANEQVELNERRSILYAQSLARQPVPVSYTCLFCGDTTEDGRRWCDTFCRDEHEKRR